MQENTVVQETNAVKQGQISGQNVVRVVEKTETVETKRLQEHYNFFGPVTFLYAVFYAFCMFRNGSGITFPFFLAGTLLYFVFHLLHRRMGDHRSEQAGGASVSDVSAAASIF